MQRNIRVKEAASYLGVSKSTLDKLRCFGGGPRYFKLGRAVVYDISDLQAWRDQRAATSTWDVANDDNLSARGAA